MNLYKFVGSDPSIICTLNKTIIASGFTRIIFGGRGAYIEFDNTHIIKSILYIPEKEKWRINSKIAYYIEYRINDLTNAKVYFQKRIVDYADYKIGYFYISPIFLENFVKVGMYEST